MIPGEFVALEGRSPGSLFDTAFRKVEGGADDRFSSSAGFTKPSQRQTTKNDRPPYRKGYLLSPGSAPLIFTTFRLLGTREASTNAKAPGVEEASSTAISLE